MDLIELWAIFGPAVAGAVFGAGWWFWVDAVVCSSVAVSFLHYLPGIFASLAALMFNCVRREDIDYSPYEEGEWRGDLNIISLLEEMAKLFTTIQEYFPSFPSNETLFRHASVLTLGYMTVSLGAKMYN
ncbi:hypothetical protein HYC85_019971 [Camellia sinensis]|uniref:Transmembrane protein 50A n=1 Tax=Camellia sinensis TaxID=4442 RepID=A0A7J7GNG9_CAMSI|nr:hypothetical protein HYC85_019971 [Camellia sinensis]